MCTKQELYFYEITEKSDMNKKTFSTWAFYVTWAIFAWTYSMEVHTGTAPTPTTKGKDSKSEILFIAKPPQSYNNPSTFDNTDLSPIIVQNRKHIPIVEKFCYLGSIISRDLKDGNDIDAHI